MANDDKARPFGLEFLEEVTDAEAQQVNGGAFRGRKPKPGKPGGPIFTTMAISLPSLKHPKGDTF